MAIIIRGANVSEEKRKLDTNEDTSRSDPGIIDNQVYGINESESNYVTRNKNDFSELRQDQDIVAESAEHDTGFNSETDVLIEKIRNEQEIKYQNLLTEKLDLEMEKIQEAINEGFEKGYADGKEKAKTELTEEFKNKLHEIESVIKTVNNTLETNLVGIDSLVLQIVVESIYKVFGEKLKDTDYALSIINNVIEKTKTNSNMVVRVSPSDYELLQNNNLELIRCNDGTKPKVIPDDRVELGGCIAETDYGTVDGRLETQLLHLKEIILSARKNNQELMR